jgi:hypothetical protein
MAPFYVLWLPPLAESQRWLLPLISASLCVPLFFASVWVEKMVALRFSGLMPESVRSWAWRANLLSYDLLVAGLLVMALIQGLHRS